MVDSPVVNLFDDEVCVCGTCLDSQEAMSNTASETAVESAADPSSREERLSAMKESILAMQWLLVGLKNEEVPHAFLNEERLDGYSPAQMAKLEEEWLRSEGIDKR